MIISVSHLQPVAPWSPGSWSSSFRDFWITSSPSISSSSESSDWLRRC